MSVLTSYEPKDVFGYFEKICSIPHGSGNTDAIADYLVEFAREHGFEHFRDSANNVIIRKPASPGYENADILICRVIMTWSAKRSRSWTSISRRTP